MMKNDVKIKTDAKLSGRGELVVVRILPDMLQALDKQVADTAVESRSTAIREVLRGYFKYKGMLE